MFLHNPISLLRPPWRFRTSQSKYILFNLFFGKQNRELGLLFNGINFSSNARPRRHLDFGILLSLRLWSGFGYRPTIRGLWVWDLLSRPQIPRLVCQRLISFSNNWTLITCFNNLIISQVLLVSDTYEDLCRIRFGFILRFLWSHQLFVLCSVAHRVVNKRGLVSRLSRFVSEPVLVVSCGAIGGPFQVR